MLEVESLDITYTSKKEVRAVREVSFAVIPGQTTTLFGQSGSGKTAITLALLGLLPENASCTGRIRWKTPQGEAIDLTDLPEKKKRNWIGKHVGWVSQGAQRALSPTRTIESLLREAIYVNGDFPKNQIETEISDLLEDLGLPQSVRKAYPDQLSGGQRQRCLLALALINRPKILIADEPTTSLDVLNEHLLLGLLRKIQTQRNIGILFITHDLRITQDFIGPSYYMENGSFVVHGESTREVSREIQKIAGPFSVEKTSITSFQGSSPTPELISINQLSVTYNSQGGVFNAKSPVKAVQQVSFSLSSGETIGIVGSSGSGKSTLAKAIAGVLAYEGQLNWQNATANSPKNIQLILQDSYSSLHPRFTIEKTLQEVIRIHHPDINKTETKALTVSYLKQVQLSEDYLSRYPNQLSGGERQRVSLARSLAANPGLLILDESISSLDFELQQRMIELILSLQSVHQLSLIVISHDFRVVSQLCQRIIVMEAGKVIESGNTQDVIQQPQHQHTQALLEAAGLSHD